MKILERYIVRSFLSAFFLTWLVLSFVLSIGLLFKVMELLTQGLRFGIVGRYLLAGLPEMIGFTIPLALLIASLLVFGRLSTDSEISAMRACGVSFGRIMRYPLLIGALASVVCFFVHSEWMPRAHFTRRTILEDAKAEVGLEILEPGRFITEVPNMKIWFAKKEGNWLHNITIIDSREEDFVREIRAGKALVTTEGPNVILDMYQVQLDPIQKGQPGAAFAERFQHTLPRAIERKIYFRKFKDYYTIELFTVAKLVREASAKSAPLIDLATATEEEKAKYQANRQFAQRECDKMVAEIRYTYNQRLVWALAPFCFVLVGVPLGVRNHRKESSIGMAISLIIAILFFLVIILTESIASEPKFFAHILIWIPVVVCIGFASYLIPRNQ